MNESLPSEADLYIPLFSRDAQYLYSIESLFSQAEKFEVVNDDFMVLYIKYLGYYLVGRRDFMRAESILQKIESFIQIFPEVSKMILIKFYISKSAYLSWHQEDNLAGIAEVNKAYKLLEEFPDAVQERLMVYNRLVQNLYFIGET